MFILQRLEEFVDNPMGKGSNAIPSRNLIKEDLTQRFNRLINEKEKKVHLDIYRNRDEYYFHFKIPSESVRQVNTYDVVLHFLLDENDKTMKDDKNLNRYMVRFFSNSPSFTYTYAYAFNLHGLLVEGLENKFRPIVLKNLPITRNPGEIISYEKTIFFACIYLLQNKKFLNKMIINAMAKPFKLKEFVSSIRNTDQIELEIAKEKRRIKELEKKENQTTASRNIVDQPRKQDKKIGGTKAKSGINKITPKSKIMPRKSSITKIRPK